jgi:PAS domain S-box-containing protein
MDENKGHAADSNLELVQREAVRASGDRFQAMADESPVILWESDANGDNKFANQTFRDFFGVTVDEVDGKQWQPLLHPEDAPSHLERFSRAVREHTAFSNEARHRRRDGEWRWLVVQARPRFSPTGEFLGHVGACVDVTERKRAEEALRESEERFRLLVQGVRDCGIYMVAPDGTVTSWTAAAEQIYGYREEEIVGRHRALFFTDEDRRAGVPQRELEEAVAHGRCEHEAWRVRKDGTQFWANVLITALRDGAGNLRGFASVHRDFTKRKEAEAALRRSEERYRSLFEHMSEGLEYCRVIFDGDRPVDYVYLDVNPAFEALTGLRDVVGKKVSEVVPEFLKSDPGVLERYGKVARDGTPDRFETYVNAKAQWFDISVYSNAPGQFVTAFHDITARKHAEEKLREQERRYRWLFEKSLDAVYVTRHSDGRILDANPAACAMHGMSVDEIRERGRAGVVVADDKLADGLVRRALLGEGRTELNMVRKDGTTFPAEVASIVVGPDGDGFTAFVIARDITERKRAEEMLRGTLHRFYSVLSGIYSPLVLVGPDERVEFVNSAFCELFRLKESPESLVGLGTPEIFEKMKDVYLHPDEATASVMQTLRQGQPVKGEEVTLRDGRTFLRDFVPLNIDGEAGGRLWMNYDITERKRAEEALREEDRRKAEFLAVLSHELRNPLAPIRNSIYLLERSAPGSRQATHAVEVIRRQTDHVTRLVDDLLDVTRISRGKIVLKRTRVDLRDIVRRTTYDLRSLFSEAGVELHVDDSSGPAWIIADPTRVTQVLGNLLQNAVKFTPAGGSATVTLAAKGDHAEIRVRDTGVGMEPEKIEHMFAPFVQAEMTLARTKGGLGLGLPLVKGLVELHGGTVEARSPGLGRGAEFLVRFPLAGIRPEADREPHAAAVARPREILVIEDNLDAGHTLAEILELEGHHVRVARDGRSGLALAHERHPDVVLCDIGLPDIDGYEVARALRRDEDLRGTRLVAVSGYAQPEDRKAARDAGFDAHVSKPPDLGELMDVLANDSELA